MLTVTEISAPCVVVIFRENTINGHDTTHFDSGY